MGPAKAAPNTASTRTSDSTPARTACRIPAGLWLLVDLPERWNHPPRQQGDDRQSGNPARAGRDRQARQGQNRAPQRYQSQPGGPPFSAVHLPPADDGDRGDVDERDEGKRPGVAEHRRGGGDAQQQVAGPAAAHGERAEEGVALGGGVVEQDEGGNNYRDPPGGRSRDAGAGDAGREQGPAEQRRRAGPDATARDWPLRPLDGVEPAIEDVVEDDSAGIEPGGGGREPRQHRRGGSSGDGISGQHVGHGGDDVGRAQQFQVPA